MGHRVEELEVLADEHQRPRRQRRRNRRAEHAPGKHEARHEDQQQQQMIEDQDRYEADAEHMLKSVQQPCIEGRIRSVIDPAQFLGVVDFLGVIKTAAENPNHFARMTSKQYAANPIRFSRTKRRSAKFASMAAAIPVGPDGPDGKALIIRGPRPQKIEVRRKRRPGGRISSRA